MSGAHGVAGWVWGGGGWVNGVAMIFWGGGAIFRDLRRPTRFGGGGGGSSRIFSVSPITISQPHSVGGGVVR